MLTCRIEPPHEIPAGSTVIGIDLTAGDKATGIAYLDGCDVHTCSLTTDDEILTFIRKQQPRIVSIDSPLGLPGGEKKLTLLQVLSESPREISLASGFLRIQH